MANPDFRLNPVMLSHVYWKRKPSFLLASDTYKEWVLFAVTEGRFRFQIGASAGEAGFGDLVICPPQAVFSREVLEHVSFHFYRFYWEDGGDAASLYPSGGKWPIRDHNRLSSTYFYLEQLSARRTDASKHIRADHMLRDLWQLICYEAVQTQTGPDEDNGMQEAARRIRQNAFGKVVMKELSARLGLSSVQFTRRFQTVYGQTPMDYLTSLRLAKAQKLLLETNMTLDQIAERCGYENGFYLSRMFTKKMDISPSAYRKSHQV